MSTIWAIGASVRALSQSLVNSGHRVIAADLFNDLDLQRVVLRMQRIVSYPQDLVSLVDQVDADAFMYTGGLENEPDLIDELATKLPLQGNPGHILRRVRDPFLLRETLLRADFRMPHMAGQVPQGMAERWLRKSAVSSGGLRIGNAQADDTLGQSEYFQLFVNGPVFGASFYSSEQGVELLGVTQQLIDCPWTGAPRFHYAGSVGPSKLSDVLQKEVERLGQYLGHQFSLRGWFGVDFMIDSDQAIHILEVNPRYTASMELLISQPAPVVGKAILYARHRATVTADFSQRLVERGDVADIPAPRTSIAAGWPVCSVFACAASEQSVLAELQAKSQALTSDFGRLPTLTGAQR